MALITVYTIEEISELLSGKGITKTSLYRALSVGKLKGIKVGKRWIISENSLNKFLEGNLLMET